jgi:hypothetical protein
VLEVTLLLQAWDLGSSSSAHQKKAPEPQG